MEFKILDMIQEIRTPILDSLMCMITKLGMQVLYGLFGSYIIADPQNKKNRGNRSGSIGSRHCLM